MYNIKNFEKEDMLSQKEVNTLKEISKDERYIKFIKELEGLNLKYNAGMLETKTKIEIINEDLKMRYDYNPIKSIQTRLKSPESIILKMNKMGLEPTIENIQGHINDIAGVRIVCKYIPDIFRIVNILKQDDDIIVLKEKNYVNNPKESGYRSYHLIIEIPIRLTTGEERVVVEIQVRTMSMDFWASLEHEIVYKYKGEIPQNVREQMFEVSREAMELDEKMNLLKDVILRNNLEN